MLGILFCRLHHLAEKAYIHLLYHENALFVVVRTKIHLPEKKPTVVMLGANGFHPFLHQNF